MIDRGLLLYSFFHNLLIITGCIFLGYYVLQGATLWLIFIMFILGMSCSTPSHKRVYRCPKCGHNLDEDDNNKEKE